MSIALVETKFFLPHAREDLLARPRLEALPWVRRSRLVLVSAPAGFGKTTLLAAWLANPRGKSAARCAWVSLDEADRDPESFWSYLLTALERASPGTGGAGLSLLGAGQPIEAVLTAVLNEVSVLAEDLDLVLDDYHLAENPGIQPGMSFLIERLPPQLRLVIGTRADPALPLARLRARGELTELRAADLRFTDDETGAFLATVTGLDLPEADVAALGARTEGWIASLQLAALSLRDRDDPSEFIAGFAGDDRYVVDYLVEEVLDRQPAEVREFLLDTAILERLSGPLCDAVSGGTGGAKMLESLERRNLFVVPLDAQRRWYRYHHLFADVLRSHLLAERPEQVAQLHRRASGWFAEAGEPVAAVRHALAAGDADRAADLVEVAIPDLARDRREAVIRAWADQLPDEVLRDRPVLGIRLVGGFMSTNEFDGVEQRLQHIEELMRRPVDEVVVVDPDDLARIPASLAMYRAALALNAGDPAGCIVYAAEAVAQTRADDHLTRASAAALAGLASWATGDLEAATAGYRVAIEGLTRVGHIADVLGCSLALADMELTLGRLEQADRTLEHALALADLHRPAGGDVMRGTADMLVARSRVAWHRNDLSGAATYLRRAEDLGESAGLAQHPYRWRVALARLRAGAGDLADALDLLDQAERVYVGDYSPQVHPIHATKARVLTAAGDLSAARAWAREHRLAADDEVSYLREYEHLTLARLMLAEHRTHPGEARLSDLLKLLDRLLTAAESGGRDGSVLEIEVLRCLAHRASGDADAALAALEHAVDLAEPDRWVRFFVDAGPELAAALAELVVRRPHSDFVRELVRQAAPGGLPVAAQPAAFPHDDVLLDPLSDRELDVLRLLGSDLDGPAIARELVVSLNTVRTHTKHIYTKLGVNNRRSAVTKAHQLGLLVRPRQP
ncbi:LuxR C-terminal-related transcriptional regulator [Nocardioides bigeumensis]|uniref:HTH luxR-type domain-containing protein n=1 Tax=Nocardioides bigeumensis TaxID=433657 RepID=A0ABP5JTD4_9ACTN